MSNTKLNGKVAFITGGNRGLGLETARELGKQGIIVVLGSRDSKKKGATAAAELRDEGITAESLGFDVNKSQDHQKAYDYFEKTYGRLDILVNNAGVWKESDTSSPSSMRRVLPVGRSARSSTGHLTVPPVPWPGVSIGLPRAARIRSSSTTTAVAGCWAMRNPTIRSAATCADAAA